MKVVRENILTRVEGVASVKLEFKKCKVVDAKICIPDYRGLEKVLTGRPYMDALVINPRVCGICGHAHLKATVLALENALKVKPTTKAKIVRDITHIAEILQNHVKWFYLYLIPDFLIKRADLTNLYEPYKGCRWRSSIEFANLFVKINAIFAGQWPHSSYMVPGGITCEPDEESIIQAIHLMEKAKSFLNMLEEDTERFKELCMEFGLEKIGISYGRFLANGKVYSDGEYKRIEPEFIEEREDFSYHSKSPLAYSWAKSVRYRGLPYEVGPMARLLQAKDKRVLHLYKIYGGSFMVRVLSRLYEIDNLIHKLDDLFKRLKEYISDPSYNDAEHPLDGEGYGMVEASRGTLLHWVLIEKGRIKDYRIITPSAWNLGPRCKDFLGVAEMALLSARDEWEANLILRSFDICSVCTTH